MKRQTRRGVFETNSSSVHSLTMCSKSDYDKWVKGELAYDNWNDELVKITSNIREKMGKCGSRYLTYDQFNDWDFIEFETFEEKYKTPGGEEVVAFGYYGHD